jgi:hypothetical protein
MSDINEIESFLRMKYSDQGYNHTNGSKTWIIWDDEVDLIFHKTTSKILSDTVKEIWSDEKFQFEEYTQDEFYYLVRTDHA